MVNAYLSSTSSKEASDHRQPPGHTKRLRMEVDWDKLYLYAVNVKGTFFCYQHAGAQMLAQGHGGRIIGSSSIMGKQGTPIMAAYSATKFVIRSLTQSAALALGPHGITVNAYAPGPIETPMPLTQGKTGDLLEILRQRSPLGINGSPADIASLVSYLVSKEAGFVTGQSVSDLSMFFRVCGKFW
ncbi:hypothetical protein E4T56_gene15844 [Termitomyces sp. T112]|nr:hypothetical protein E4T56_gene15844 [Termitomyces sp. T112]